MKHVNALKMAANGHYQEQHEDNKGKPKLRYLFTFQYLRVLLSLVINSRQTFTILWMFMKTMIHTHVMIITTCNSLHTEKQLSERLVPIPPQVGFGYKSHLFGPLMDVISGSSIGSWQLLWKKVIQRIAPWKFPNRCFRVAATTTHAPQHGLDLVICT